MRGVFGGDFNSARKVFNGVCTSGGGVAGGGGVPASDWLPRGRRGGCFDGGGGSSDGARGVASLLAAGRATSVPGPGSGSGVASASDAGFRAVGLRLVGRAAEEEEAADLGGRGAEAGVSEPPERTRLPRAVFGVAAAEEDDPGVAVTRRDFRRGVGATSSSNSSSDSPLMASSSSSYFSSSSAPESEDSITFRRDAAARREGRAGVIADMESESTELNGRFVMGDGEALRRRRGDSWERGRRGGSGEWEGEIYLMCL